MEKIQYSEKVEMAIFANYRWLVDGHVIRIKPAGEYFVKKSARYLPLKWPTEKLSSIAIPEVKRELGRDRSIIVNPHSVFCPLLYSLVYAELLILLCTKTSIYSRCPGYQGCTENQHS